MTFKILLDTGDGDRKVLAEIDDKRVARVGLSSKYGESGALGVDPGTTECVISLQFATGTDLHNLEQALVQSVLPSEPIVDATPDPEPESDPAPEKKVK